MSKCKHENADHLMPGESMVAHGVRCWPPVVVEQLRCLDYGAWLGLGPARETPDTLVEIRAAALADNSDFCESEWLGWNQDEQYIMCGELRTVHDDMSDARFAGWSAGWLAAEIAARPEQEKNGDDRKLRHSDGDAIELDIIDGELVSLTVKQGPHEICRLAFTGAELDVLIERLACARQKAKP